MTPKERLAIIEKKYEARGLNPCDYLPPFPPIPFAKGREDEMTLKIAMFLEKVLDAMSKDSK